MKFKNIQLHSDSLYKKNAGEKEIVTKIIPYFEPIKWFVFTTGIRVSKEYQQWDDKRIEMNERILSLPKRKRNKIDLQMLADCQAWSFENCSNEILFNTKNAKPEVVDFESTFRDSIY